MYVAVSRWKAQKALWPAAAGLGLVLAWSCNSLTGADDITFFDCVPGEQRACSCSGQRSGTQVCDAQGTGFGSCRCAGQTGVGSLAVAGAGGVTSGRGGSSGEAAPAPVRSAGGGGAGCPETSFSQDGECHQDAIQVAAGFFHDCVVLRDSTVRCWGDNESGQLGNGTREDSVLPVAVTGLANVQQLALGDDHSCALHDGGTVSCWGENEQGQLGDGTTVDALTPVRVRGVTGAVSVAMTTASKDSSTATCAALDDGAVRCWGDGQQVTALSGFEEDAIAVAVQNQAGCALLADGAVQCWLTSSGPVQEPLLTGAVALIAGPLHSCAISSEGTVRCWGYNQYGQLGSAADVMTTVPAPVIVPGLSSVTDLGLGLRHSCALSGGLVRCWGSGANGQLGSAGETSLTPLLVPGLAGVTALAGGTFHTCALLDEGSVRCWGDVVGAVQDTATPISVAGW